MENIYNDIIQLEPILIPEWNKPYNELDNSRTKAQRLQQQY